MKLELGKQYGTGLVEEIPEPQTPEATMPEGFTYYGMGPLKVKSEDPTHDICRWAMTSKRWSTTSWEGGIAGIYAIRSNTPLAWQNGLDLPYVSMTSEDLEVSRKDSDTRIAALHTELASVREQLATAESRVLELEEEIENRNREIEGWQSAAEGNKKLARENGEMLTKTHNAMAEWMKKANDSEDRATRAEAILDAQIHAARLTVDYISLTNPQAPDNPTTHGR